MTNDARTLLNGRKCVLITALEDYQRYRKLPRKRPERLHCENPEVRGGHEHGYRLQHLYVSPDSQQTNTIHFSK